MDEYSAVYLMYVEGDETTNSNKFYRMENNGDGTFKATWGRVGNSGQTKNYPISQWEKKRREKIKKGYIEITEFMEDVIKDSQVAPDTNSSPEDKFSIITVDSIREVLRRLYSYANHVVQTSYRVSASVVTQAQVDKAQEQIDFISSNYKDWDLKKFNSELKVLFKILPRIMSRVSDYLATNMEEEHIQKIMTREQDTLDSMQTMIYKPKHINVEQKVEEDSVEKAQILTRNSDIWNDLGFIMGEATLDDIELIKKMLGDSKDKFYRAWKVFNTEADNRFCKFCKDHNIKETALLGHGSRNSNWFNILSQSLMIRPSNVIIQGSLLGNALYFSNPENYHGGTIKSIRYSSLNGYWSGEYQNCGFIAFFEVATGKRYDIYNFDSRYHTYTQEKLQRDCPGAWSLHLHGAGYGGASTVINDEITVYNPEQATIRYLVEIR